MTDKCLTCGKVFTNNKKNRKYCGRECFHKSHKLFNEISIYDNYAVMFIESKAYGRIAVNVDIEDVEKISKYRWHAIYDKTINNY